MRGKYHKRRLCFGRPRRSSRIALSISSLTYNLSCHHKALECAESCSAHYHCTAQHQKCPPLMQPTLSGWQRFAVFPCTSPGVITERIGRHSLRTLRIARTNVHSLTISWSVPPLTDRTGYTKPSDRHALRCNTHIHTDVVYLHTPETNIDLSPSSPPMTTDTPASHGNCCPGRPRRTCCCYCCRTADPGPAPAGCTAGPGSPADAPLDSLLRVPAV